MVKLEMTNYSIASNDDGLGSPMWDARLVMPWLIYVFGDVPNVAVFRRFESRQDAINMFESWNGQLTLSDLAWYEIFY